MRVSTRTAEKSLRALCVLSFACATFAQPPFQPLPDIAPPRSENLFVTMRRIQEVRNLQLQNMRLQQEIQIRAEQQRLNGTMPLQQPPPPPQQQPAPALVTNDLLTGGLLNCRAWATADYDKRLSYLAGVTEASLLLLWEVNKAEDAARYLPAALNNGEVSPLITDMCEQPENRAVPVVFIFRLAAGKANGMAPDALQRQAAMYRKVA